MKLCVIPARGGSKRIKNKNIKFFVQKEIIYYSIKAALNSKLFDKIIVSTDSKAIAKIAEKYGAEVPFVRPANISDDQTATIPVIKHAIKFYESQNILIDDVCCIYATAPFVTADILERAKSLLGSSRPDSVVFAATSFPHPIQRSLILDSDGYSTAMDPVSISMRSQDLVEAYHDAGQFYWASQKAWNGSGNLLEDARPLILPRWSVQDIDTEEDWRRAELMHAALYEDFKNG